MFSDSLKSFFVLLVFSISVLGGCGESSKDKPEQESKEQYASKTERMPTDLKDVAELMSG